VISLRRRIVEAALVTAMIAVGVAIRVGHLDASPFWVDEAESSINALTILEHGYPVDHYLGIPIFENTLIKPWPGNPEYEFKDISYSDRGIATYHGWLPLYSIAASFAMNGIRPDRLNDGHPARDLTEMKRRTRAARIPSVVFGALFLAFCYMAGTIMYGRDAGIAALLTATFMTFHIDASIQARYYSEVITLSTCAVMALWLMLTKGMLRHYVLGAIVFLLLFFTHLVTFAAAVFVFVLLTPAMFLRHERALTKLVVFGAILLVGVVSWVAATGFLSGLGIIPAARSYLSFPDDLFAYPVGRGAHICIFFGFLLLILATFSPRFRMPARLAKPLQDAAMAVFVLTLWILAAYGAFFLFIPAVSFDVSRLKFPYWGPALLLASIFCAAAARTISPRLSAGVAPAIAFLLAATTGVQLFNESRLLPGWKRIASIQEYIQHSELTADTKLYALPNSHLILSFYTGLPFQTIYPVRKTFLDAYQGEIVYFDFDPFGLKSPLLAPDRLRQAAVRTGDVLDDEGAQLLSRRLRTFQYRQSMSERIGGAPKTAVELVPPYAEQLLKRERVTDSAKFLEMCAGTPILRGYHITNWHEWIGSFVYRFVDPESRMGPALNYAERLRGSRAEILTDTGWVVYRSPHDRDRNAAVTFRFQ
jgi:hypothetical protein